VKRLLPAACTVSPVRRDERSICDFSDPVSRISPLPGAGRATYRVNTGAVVAVAATGHS